MKQPRGNRNRHVNCCQILIYLLLGCSNDCCKLLPPRLCNNNSNNGQRQCALLSGSAFYKGNNRLNMHEILRIGTSPRYNIHRQTVAFRIASLECLNSYFPRVFLNNEPSAFSRAACGKISCRSRSQCLECIYVCVLMFSSISMTLLYYRWMFLSVENGRNKFDFGPACSAFQDIGISVVSCRNL